MKFSNKQEFFKFLDGIVEDTKKHVNGENYNFLLCNIIVMISILEQKSDDEVSQIHDIIKSCIERRN